MGLSNPRTISSDGRLNAMLLSMLGNAATGICEAKARDVAAYLYGR
jgi:hypothetical protein